MVASTAANAAGRTADFVGSIGVNTHISWSGPWANWSNVEAELSYIGVTNVRDSVPYANLDLSEYQRLAAEGIKFDLITTGPNVNIAGDLANIDALQTSNPGSVASIEGTNEFNANNDIFNGQNSYNNPAWGAGLDAALNSAVAADPILRGTTVVAASLANAGVAQITAQGNVASVVGASNWHAYFSQGSQPGVNIQSGITNAQLTAPGRSVYITESGNYTALNAEAWGGGGVNQDVQAKMAINLLLDAYKDGASKTFIYALMDNVTNPSSTDLEDSFGIFNGDGTPKTAATALHNLTSLMSDTGSTSRSFAPGSLQYSLTGTTSQDNSLLLEKSGGVFDLALWNEQPIWNEATNTEIPATTHTVTLNLGQSANVAVYDVLTGSLVSQSDDASSVNVLMSDRPLIVQVTPTPSAVCFVAGTLIRTARGDVPVEALVVGDLAVTMSGALRPIVWTGHQVLKFEVSGRSEARPVRVRANAFGGGLPERDLWLSPGHPVLVGGGSNEVLVPIMCLINGTSIERVAVDQVSYWHVELEVHDLLLAEGLPAESYLDWGDRPWFENASAHALLNPDFVVPGLSSRCRPVALDGALVEAERRRINAIFEASLSKPCAWPCFHEEWAAWIA